MNQLCVLRKHHKSGGGFCNDQIFRFFFCIKLTHHRTADQYMVILKGCTACHGKAIGKGCAERSMNNDRICHGACHGQVFAGKDLIPGSLIDGIHGSSIGNYTSNIQRNTGWRNGSSCYIAYHDLLITCRVEVFHPEELNRGSSLLDRFRKCVDFFIVSLL